MLQNKVNANHTKQSFVRQLLPFLLALQSWYKALQKKEPTQNQIMFSHLYNCEVYIRQIILSTKI